MIEEEASIARKETKIASKNKLFLWYLIDQRLSTKPNISNKKKK